jgi:hypothetical protein
MSIPWGEWVVWRTPGVTATGGLVFSSYVHTIRDAGF